MKPASKALEFQEMRALQVTYRNWKGKVTERTILPLRVRYGSTKWHPKPQWLLDALDMNKAEERSFAMKDFLNVRPGAKILALCTDGEIRKATITKAAGPPQNPHLEAYMLYGTKRVKGALAWSVNSKGEKLKPVKWLFSTDAHHVLEQFPEL